LRRKLLTAAFDRPGSTSITAAISTIRAVGGQATGCVPARYCRQVANGTARLGFIGRLPIQDAQLQLGATTLAVQQSALDFLLGMTFDFE
jgi:hypothetical protein